jgi:hypothetical protein
LITNAVLLQVLVNWLGMEGVGFRSTLTVCVLLHPLAVSVYT